MGFVKIAPVRGMTEIVDLLHFLPPDSWILGGYARYVADRSKNPAPPGDIDVYCADMGCFGIVIAELRERGGLEIKHETEFAVSFARPEKGPLSYLPPIQVVRPVIAGGSLAEILEKFDFTVARAGIIDGRTVMVDEDFEVDTAKKRLVIRSVHCPVSSVTRIVKYVKKGYWIKPTEILKLFLDWDARTPEYRGKLREFFESTASASLTQEEIEEFEALLRVVD